MKTLKQHIDEALKIGKNLSEWSSYSCQPKTYKELKQIIKDRIDKEGPNCDLNDIDTLLIEDMSWLFRHSSFNGDISKWDVSNVEYMNHMFDSSDFNQLIRDWDVSKVNNMRWMFRNSEFNKDISKWNIKSNCDTTKMFKDCHIKEEYKPVLPK